MCVCVCGHYHKLLGLIFQSPACAPGMLHPVDDTDQARAKKEALGKLEKERFNEFANWYKGNSHEIVERAALAITISPLHLLFIVLQPTGKLCP